MDDEENIISSLSRLLRRDGYQIFKANSGREGLELLKQHDVGVVISDQRMPEMIGSEFLSKARDLRPQTVRIMLSGYTDLQSVTDAINRGAIFRFLTKPWDDDLLRQNIEEAFRYHEMAAENERLTRDLKIANDALMAANIRLGDETKVLSRDVERNLRVLEVSQEVLESLPLAVIGVGNDGMVAVANSKARELFGTEIMPGEQQNAVLPEEVITLMGQGSNGKKRITLHGVEVDCWCFVMGQHSRAQGSVTVLAPV
ncbi:MAG: response regulator [Pseudomonadota bacterium]